MMKKYVTMILCAVLILSFSTGVSASAETPDLEIVSTYRTEDTLYSFLRFDTNEPGKFKASTAELGGTAVEPVIFTKGGMEASYVVLLDKSLSMKDHMDEAAAFMETLMSNKLWNSRCILIPYNTQLYTNEMTDTAGLESDAALNELERAIDTMELVDSDNLSSACIIEALDYLSDHYPENGGLVNLVLITDDLMDMSGNAFLDARNRLNATPEVLFHTLRLGGTSDIGTRYKNKGLNLVINEENDAEEAAKSILNCVGKLYRVALPWTDTENQSGRTTAEWFLQFFQNDGDTAIVKTISVDVENIALIKQNDAAGSAPAEGGTQAPPTQTEEPSESAPETGEGSGIGESGSEPNDSDIEADPAEADNERFGNELLTEFEEEPEPSKLWVVAFVSAAIIVLAVAIFVLLRIKGQRSTPANAIHMQIDVLSGKYKGKKKEFSLVDELLIGRDSRCDIVFSDEAVSDVNSRVFIRDGFIYIEDLNSSRGTAIEGMSIYSPNRLKSGYEVSIGNVRFKFYF